MWRNISSFDIQNQDKTSCMLRQFTKINGLSWSRCPFWNIFLLIKFGIENEAMRSKSIYFFTLVCPFVDEKRSNAYGHNSVAITYFQQIIAFKSMLRARYVTIIILLPQIPFWWCASTPLKSMVWFAEIMLSLKNRLLKAPFSEWYFRIFTPNVAVYCSNPCFALTAFFLWWIHLSVHQSI